MAVGWYHMYSTGEADDGDILQPLAAREAVEEPGGLWVKICGRRAGPGKVVSGDAVWVLACAVRVHVRACTRSQFVHSPLS